MSDELPEGWASAALTAVGNLQNGPFGSLLHRSDYVVNGVPLINPANIVDGWLVPDLDITVGPEVPNRLSAYIMQPGDIVVARRGEMGRAALVSSERTAWFCGTGCAFVRPGPVITGPFLAYWFGSPGVRSRLENDAVGATMSNLSTRILGNLDVALPPLPEQLRIVAKVESLLEQVNRAKGRLERVTAILRRFRQAVLAAACSGDLTDTWRAHNVSAGTTFANAKSADVDDLARPELPETWQWACLDTIADFINGDRSKRYPNKEEYVASGLPFINTGHIEPDGSLSLDRMNYISREKWASLTGGKIQKGDLVYCLRGATLGKTAFVEPFTEGTIASSLVIIRPKKPVLTRYLYFFLISPVGREEIRKYDNGSAQPNLSAQNVGRYLVPIPPLEEQAEIVRQVDRLFALAGTIERRVKVATARADKLPQAILSKAFSGELVPTEAELARAEGRTYETAEAMLARIRNDRPEAPEKRKRAPRKEK